MCVLLNFNYIAITGFLFRMAAERDLEKSEAINLANIVFDESGFFVLYATMLGVKVVNLFNNRCVKIIGKPENLRPLNLAIFQVRIAWYQSDSKNLIFYFIFIIIKHLFPSVVI